MMVQRMRVASTNIAVVILDLPVEVQGVMKIS